MKVLELKSKTEPLAGRSARWAETRAWAEMGLEPAVGAW